MAAEAATLPLSITISMGDVSFRLNPSTEPSSSTGFRRSPSPRKASPSSRRRQSLKSSISYVGNSKIETTSPPIVSIRQGFSSSQTLRPIRKSSFVSSGHVREIKESIEAQQESRRRSSIYSSQVAAADASTSTSGYFIDLHSFTGTLQIIPSKYSGAQTKPQTP